MRGQTAAAALLLLVCALQMRAATSQDACDSDLAANTFYVDPSTNKSEFQTYFEDAVKTLPEDEISQFKGYQTKIEKTAANRQLSPTDRQKQISDTLNSFSSDPSRLESLFKSPLTNGYTFMKFVQCSLGSSSILGDNNPDFFWVRDIVFLILGSYSGKKPSQVKNYMNAGADLVMDEDDRVDAYYRLYYYFQRAKVNNFTADDTAEQVFEMVLSACSDAASDNNACHKQDQEYPDDSDQSANELIGEAYGQAAEQYEIAESITLTNTIRTIPPLVDSQNHTVKTLKSLATSISAGVELSCAPTKTYFSKMTSALNSLIGTAAYGQRVVYSNFEAAILTDLETASDSVFESYSDASCTEDQDTYQQALETCVKAWNSG